MPRPTIANVPPIRLGHEGSGIGPSGAARSPTSTKCVGTRPMPSRSCATSSIASSEETVPPSRKSSSEIRRYSGTSTRVLEQAVDLDHVHADELLPAPDRLGGYLPDMRDELELQATRLLAAPTGTHVELDEPTLRVESTMQGDGRTSDGGHRRRAVQRIGVAREEGRVALDLDEIESLRGIDDLVEHASRCCLRVAEDAAVELHVLRVAADVRDQEQRTPSGHGAGR